MLRDMVDSFVIWIIFLVIVFGVILSALLLTGAWGFKKLSEINADAEPHYVGRIRKSETVTGTVTQIRENRPQRSVKASRYDYQLAVSYHREQEQLTALFSLSTEQPLALQEGSRIKLHIFPSPLMQPNENAWQRTRLAAGFLPKESVHCREYHGIPMDETATVMFEEDFQRYRMSEEDRWLASNPTAVPDVLRIVAVVLGLLGILAFLSLFVILR